MVVTELFARLGLKVDESAFNRADAAIGSLKKGLAAIGVTLAAGAVIRGLQHLVDETANAAGAAQKAAQRVGITRQALEELNHAADESEIPIEGLETGLRFLSRNLYETTQGNHQLTHAFQQLGVRTTDAGGKLRSADDVLMELSERFQTMPDGPKKTALAMQLFGRTGTELIPMLNKGRVVLSEYRQEAHELGLVFSDEAVASAKEYRKAGHDLSDTFEGIKRQIGVGLLPQLTKLRQEFAGWLKENRELIRQRMTALAMGLATALKFVAQLLEPVVRFIAFLASNAWLAVAAVTALGLALNWAFLLPVAAIGTLLLLIEELWGWITGKRETLLEEWFGSFDDLKKNSNFLQGIVEAIDKISLAIQHAGNAWRNFKALFGIGKSTYDEELENDSFAMRRGFAAAGAEESYTAQERLAGNPRFTALARASEWATISQEFNPAVQAGLVPPPVNVTIGDINIGSGAVPSGSTPDELVKKLGDEIENRMRVTISEAYAGVTR